MAMTEDGIAVAAATLTAAAIQLETTTRKVVGTDAATTVDLVEVIYLNMLNVVSKATAKPKSTQKGSVETF